ncbi:MAG: VWA domain-containing protein [Acidobacteria bacterium]|nr:MAG: VWA domain-containing protein [Acidobacteriota bacterium]
MRPPSLSLFAAALLICAALPVAGEEKPSLAPIEETIGVVVVNVDVVVVDKKGRPITGLTRDDFELLVDGRPTPLSNFFEVRDHAVAGERPASPAAGATTPEEPAHVVVLIDNNHLTPAGRERMLEVLPRFIEHEVRAGARVMTVLHDQAPQVLQPFGADARAHAESLRAIADSTIEGIARRRAWSGFIDDVRALLDSCDAVTFVPDAPCVACAPDLINQARIYAQTAQDQRQRSLGGLAAVASALRGLPGRKVLLYVSDGFPQRPGIEALYYLQELCPENATNFQNVLRDRPGAEQLRSLVAHANANRVTIYSLEARGLEAFSAASVEYANIPRGATIGGGVGNPSPVVDDVLTANRQGALFYVANETGGRALLNLNDPAPELIKLEAELGHYYSLGFTPGGPADRDIHYLGVRLPRLRAKATVRHRRVFRHTSREDEIGERALGAQLLGVESNELEARVVIGVPGAQTGGAFRVPVDVFIPLERLSLLPGDRLERGRLAVIVAAPDRRTHRTTLRKQEIGVALPDDARGYCRLGFELELEAGEHLLGLGLWDRQADRTSFLRLPVSVDPERALPPAGAAAGAASTPAGR